MKIILVTIIILLLTTFTFAETVAGFDPGMNIPRIATAYRGHYYDFDLCLDLPNNLCYGNALAGSGFYNLEAYFGDSGNFDNECKINSGEIYDYYYSWNNITHENVPCPYYFQWKNYPDDLVADLKIDSREFDNAEENYFMLNIQETGDKYDLLWNQYWGISKDWVNDYNKFPEIHNVEKVSFDIRSNLCYGENGIGIGRTYQYFTVYSPSQKNWQTIAIDLFSFRNVPNNTYWNNRNFLVNTIAFESDLVGCQTQECAQQQDRWRIIQLNANNIGIINYAPFVDTTNDCSSSINNLSWEHIDINVQNLLNILIDQNFFDKRLLSDGRYVSRIYDDSLVYNQNWPQYQTITLGIETYGKNLLNVQIKDRLIKLKETPLQQNSICSQFQERYSTPQLTTHINDWKNGQHSLLEILRRAKINKYCS